MEQMIKSRTSSNNKLHFVVTHAGKTFKIRAGCLVLRDYDGNCLMINEPKLSRGRTVIGFCGGTVEDHDKDIIDTVLREMYEECILKDSLPIDWVKQWLDIQARFIHAPITLNEIIFNYIYTICKTRQRIYVDGHNADLKSMYFQVVLPRLYSDYLVANYNMLVINVQMFEVMNKLRDTQPVKYCLRFGVPSYSVQELHFRLREIMISTPTFCIFLKCGLPKIDSEPPRSSVQEIASQSSWYSVCNTAQRLIEACPNDPMIKDVCTMMTVLMSRIEWQQIFDLWYRVDKVEYGLDVINLVNHFLYGCMLKKELIPKRDEISLILALHYV
jgi:hypothetical protein